MKKQEIIKLIKKIFIFSVPIWVWIILLLTVDPFNYFSYSKAIPNAIKEQSAKSLNSLLYNSVSYINNPNQNIIIGDSRIRRFSNKISKNGIVNEYFIFHSNAAKINEIIDIFWMANDQIALKNVIIGINFNLYNKYAYANRVVDVVEMIDNPLIYVFNGNTFEATIQTIQEYYAVSSIPLLKNIKSGKELRKAKRNKKEFWEYNIKTVAKNHYSRYKYPDELFLKLTKIGDYCEINNINLTFVIVPHHQEFRDRIGDFNLQKEEKKFQHDVSSIARVIDFDFPNQITNCKECFSDPIHTNDSISKLISEEIYRDSLKIGRLLK